MLMPVYSSMNAYKQQNLLLDALQDVCKALNEGMNYVKTF